MARTKAEVRAFLDSQVGQIPQHPAPYNTGANNLSGQCVTGVKALLNFLGVPNPYSARGNATDVDDTLLRQGIAQNGRGWLTIVVNHDMGFIGGVHYGHIWIDLMNEANYETNGNSPLHTTKNTRPISQGQQFVNLDNYITEEDAGMKIGSGDNWRARFNRLHHQLVRNGDMPDSVFQSIIGLDAWSVCESWSDHPEANTLIHWQEVGQQAEQDNWTGQIYGLQDERNKANAALLQAQQDLANANTTDKKELADAQAALADAQAQAKKAQDALSAKLATDTATDNSVTNVLRSLWNKITGGK